MTPTEALAVLTDTAAKYAESAQWCLKHGDLIGAQEQDAEAERCREAHATLAAMVDANHTLREAAKKVMVENNRLRNELGFYADIGNWDAAEPDASWSRVYCGPVFENCGHGWYRAKKALLLNASRLLAAIIEYLDEPLPTPPDPQP